MAPRLSSVGIACRRRRRQYYFDVGEEVRVAKRKEEGRAAVRVVGWRVPFRLLYACYHIDNAYRIMW